MSPPAHGVGCDVMCGRVLLGMDLLGWQGRAGANRRPGKRDAVCNHRGSLKDFLEHVYTQLLQQAHLSLAGVGSLDAWVRSLRRCCCGCRLQLYKL
jgi:hypothetical protein